MFVSNYGGGGRGEEESIQSRKSSFGKLDLKIEYKFNVVFSNESDFI